ncbi:MAG: hypothetical protein GX951_05675 [Mollicutes bacterium]|nr:hypothetical protein [Mollicutes bacterium]
MTTKSFFKIFDRQKFSFTIKFSSIILALIIIINIIGLTYSRYTSTAQMYANPQVAFFVVGQSTQEQTITLEGLAPSTDKYLYTINVNNFKDGLRAKVDLKYSIAFKTTTNLPLSYEVIRNEVYSPSATDIIVNRNIIQEADVYYQMLTTTGQRTFLHSANETDQYTIVVTFPPEYKDFPDDYQGKIEMISVIVSAEQVV